MCIMYTRKHGHFHLKKKKRKSKGRYYSFHTLKFSRHLLCCNLSIDQTSLRYVIPLINQTRIKWIARRWKNTVGNQTYSTYYVIISIHWTHLLKHNVWNSAQHGMKLTALLHDNFFTHFLYLWALTQRTACHSTSCSHVKTKFGQKFATFQAVLAAHKKESRTFIQKGTMSLKKKKMQRKKKTIVFCSSCQLRSVDILLLACN